ncbi:unnamed protein product, partial [Prorocentrum cordatum]
MLPVSCLRLCQAARAVDRKDSKTKGVLLACAVAVVTCGLVGARARAFAQGREVLVTGASGRTGRLVVQRLLEAAGKFQVRALVRSEGSGKELLGALPGLKEEKVFVGDVLSPETLPPAIAGCLALVIVTSAVPRT